MASLKLTWRSVPDERRCKICEALEGYVWTFDVGADQFGDELTHPQFGVVWNVHVGSRAHGHGEFHCRCHIEHEFDFGDLVEKVTQLHQEVLAMAESYAKASGGLTA